jgi:biopolymer transport protein ExbB/TolQ
VNIVGTIVRFIQDGGSFMYVILTVFVVGFAIALERWLYLNKARKSNRVVWDQLFPLVRNGEFKKAAMLAAESKTPIGNMVAFGLNQMYANGGHDEERRMLPAVEMAMEEALMEVTPRLEKRTPYLAILANVATLLGLLGTILGLIDAFGAVANADPAEKGAILSSSISLAMNATAFGLITAIPLLLFHALLQTKTTEIVDSLEMAAVKILNLIRKPEDGDQPAKAIAR